MELWYLAPIKNALLKSTLTSSYNQILYSLHVSKSVLTFHTPIYFTWFTCFFFFYSFCHFFFSLLFFNIICIKTKNLRWNFQNCRGLVGGEDRKWLLGFPRRDHCWQEAVCTPADEILGFWKNCSGILGCKRENRFV